MRHDRIRLVAVALPIPAQVRVTAIGVQIEVCDTVRIRPREFGDDVRAIIHRAAQVLLLRQKLLRFRDGIRLACGMFERVSCFIYCRGTQTAYGR